MELKIDERLRDVLIPLTDEKFAALEEDILRNGCIQPIIVWNGTIVDGHNRYAMGIEFVMHTLMPWLVRIEQAMIKDLLVEDEQNELFPKFNVDGLMRGDYKSRMEGYAIAINNGIMSVNDVRRLEDLDPLDEGEGGDFHIINGSYTKLADVGKNYGGNKAAEEEQSATEAPAPQEEDRGDEEQLERETPGHARRRAERKAVRQGSPAKPGNNGGERICENSGPGSETTEAAECCGWTARLTRSRSGRTA